MNSICCILTTIFLALPVVETLFFAYMCRLLVVRSLGSVALENFTTKPEHSIIKQASDCRLRLDGGPSNADGFGVAWYDADKQPDTLSKPCIFSAITPAWSNRNLQRIASKVKSPLVFAHVRASTTGALSEENCHPWCYGSLLWMHNGCVAQFASKIKRRLQTALADEFYNIPQGQTDSEWAFALFLQLLSDALPGVSISETPTFSFAVLRDVMMRTIQQLNAWAKEAGVTEPSLLNFSVSDGYSIVCSRYISSTTQEAASLYFSTGSSFDEVEPGTYRMRSHDRREKLILIASEPLTFEKEDWLEIPCQTLIVITPKMNLLQVPIVDEHWQDARGAAARSLEFATSKGMHFGK